MVVVYSWCRHKSHPSTVNQEYTLDRSVKGPLVYICTGQFYLNVISDQSKTYA